MADLANPSGVVTSSESATRGQTRREGASAPRRSFINRFRRNPQFWRAVWLGLLSLGLYVALFAHEQTVLAWSVGRWWSFLVPLVIAFVFSFAHGAFTGAFWDAVGLKPRPPKKKT